MNLSKENLEARTNELIQDLGSVELKEMLAGGVVSDVYSALLQDNKGKTKEVVVKYTREDIPLGNIFSRMDRDETFFQAQDEQDLDINLQSILTVAIPKVIKHFPTDHISLMENFNNDGYQLLQSRLINEDIPVGTASELGKTLAIMRNDLEQDNNTFKQLESSQFQFNERFLELKVLLYNGRMDIFNEIEDDFLIGVGNKVMWTDGDQKNFAVNAKGKAMVYDLGRSIVCDPDFMLPNLLGHLGLFAISGFLKDYPKFLADCVASFEATYLKLNPAYSINEQKFVNYFTASLLHRGMAMRWIDSRIAKNIGEDSLKNACMHFGDIVFAKDARIVTIHKLYSALQAVANLASTGAYKRKPIIVG